MKNKFSEQLNGLRIESNLSRVQLAEKLNVSVRLISYWENGQRECDFDMLIKIAEFFECSLDYLFGLTDINKNNALCGYNHEKFLERYLKVLEENENILI